MLYIYIYTNKLTYIIYSQLTGISTKDEVEADNSHHPLLIRILASEMNVERKTP